MEGLDQITVKGAQPITLNAGTAYRMRAPETIKALDSVRVRERLALRRAEDPWVRSAPLGTLWLAYAAASGRSRPAGAGGRTVRAGRHRPARHGSRVPQAPHLRRPPQQARVGACPDRGVEGREAAQDARRDDFVAVSARLKSHSRVDPLQAGAQQLPKSILDLGAQPTRSPLEDRVYDFVVAAGLERPLANPVYRLPGRTVFPTCTGRSTGWSSRSTASTWHDDPLARRDDAERQAELEAAGERVLRVTERGHAQPAARPRAAARRRGDLEGAAAGERAAERDLVRVLEVAADRQPARRAG